jgi:hypothetical protein
MGPGREVESPPCSAEVEYERRHTSAPPECLHGLDRNKIDLLPLPCALACGAVHDDLRSVNHRLCDYHLSLPVLLPRISSCQTEVLYFARNGSDADSLHNSARSCV